MKKTYLTGILFFLMFSCQINEDPFQNSQLTNGDNEVSKIYFKSGYLVFQSDAVLQETLQTLQTMSDQEKILWSQRYQGFNSMLDFYDQAMKKDANFGDRVLNGEDIEFSETQKTQIEEEKIVHSKFVNDNINYFHVEDGEGQINMDIFRYDMAPIVNKEGLVKVGSYIYQYTRDYLKVAENPTVADIQQIVNLTEDNDDLGLTINKVQHEYATQNDENLRSYFYGTCASIRAYHIGGSEERQENTVEINTVTSPVTQTVPCSKFDPDCVVTTITGYQTTQTFQLRSWGRHKICMPLLPCFKVNSSLTHYQNGNYYFNGVYKTYNVSSSQPTVFMNTTLYSGLQADIVNANLSFLGCGSFNCYDWDSCTITF